MSVCICVCCYICVGVWACVHVETAGQPQMLSLRCCPPFYLFTFGDKFSHWLGVGELVGLVGHWAPRTCCLLANVCGTMPVFSPLWDLRLNSYYCLINKLDLLILFYMYVFYLYVCICTMCGGQKGQRISQNWSYRWFWATM